MISDSAPLLEALCLPSRGVLLSIVGGGGKSALLFAVGEKLEGAVVLSTTTRIFAAQMSRAKARLSLESGPFDSVWPACGSGLLVVGAVEGDKAVGVTADQPARWLLRSDVDHVVVEADGSRMRPTKLPAEHEPVIADSSTHVAVVAGLDALDGRIAERCHRPERVGAFVGKPTDRFLEEEDLARILVAPDGGCKNVPSDARLVVVLNKVESELQHAAAERIARLILREIRVDRVIAGALEGENPDRWRVYRRG